MRLCGFDVIGVGRERGPASGDRSPQPIEPTSLAVPA